MKTGFSSSKNRSQDRNTKWTKTLIFTALGTTFGSSVPLGYTISVINSPATFIIEWCNKTLIKRYDAHLSDSALIWLWSSIVASVLIGAAISSLFGASMANRFGRRFTLFVSGMLYVISAICFYFCRLLSLVELLFVGRLISGFAGGITLSCLALYHSELAKLEHRGSFGVFCPIGLTAGVLLGQVFSLSDLLGNEELWHYSLSLFIIPVIISYAPYKLYPESPTWLYVKVGRRDMAEVELKRLRTDVSPEAIAKELDMLDVEMKQNSQKSKFCEVLGDPKLRLPIIIVCVFTMGQPFSGINAIFFYSVLIYLKAGLTQQQASIANLGTGILNLAVSLFSPYLMRRFNRRPLMLISTFFCMISLTFLALLLQYIDFVSWFPIMAIGFILLYICFYQVGFSPIPFFIGSELFEAAPRPVAMSLGSLCSSSGNFIVAIAFPTLENLWGGFVFLPFAFTCLLVFLLTLFYLPETRGRDPTEISPLVANGFKSKVRSR